MARFFIPQPCVSPDIVLKGQEAHHLIHVYRAKPGDPVDLFDPQGYEYRTEVVSCTKHEARLKVISRSLPEKKEGVRIYLAQGLLKNKAWDLMLQKMMELGLHCLFPLITKHVVNGNKASEREDRWQKIVIAAAKQCRSNSLLTITPAKRFQDLISETSHFPLRILAHNGEGLPTFREVLDKYNGTPDQVLAMIGPEGGFSKEELEEASRAGFRLFSLGNNTLRAETAAMAIVANLSFYFQK